MRRYYTGLLPHSNESLLKPLVARGWSVTTEPKLKDKTRDTIASSREEVVIHAKTFNRARSAFSLILDSWAVLNGELPERDELLLIPEDKQERTKLEVDNPFNNHGSWSTSGFLLSCVIAQKASFQNKFVYAIALCRQSLALHSNYFGDLEPGLFPYEQRSPCPRDHIRFAYAIIAAYAVLEQLGFALHGECFEKGKWITEKRQGLESRLQASGLDLNNSVLWQIRGGKTKLELKRPPTVLRKCTWSGGAIRDCEVELIDAIADLRWLRSRVAAHDVDDWVSRLSVHDVSNAQRLARRAVLDAMGFTRKTIHKLHHEFSKV